MTFEFLVTKWRILLSALEVSLKNARKVFNACCILHNWCIDEWVLFEDGRTEKIIKKVYMEGNQCLGYARKVTPNGSV
jgi:hypothetical protein